jgi:hypothetical protein
MNPDDQPILDWHLNERFSPDEAMSILAEAVVAELLTPSSIDPIYRQLDEKYPTWQAYNDKMKWELGADDYLYHPNLGAMMPVAMAWLGTEKIVVYKCRVFCISQPDGSFTVGRIP